MARQYHFENWSEVLYLLGALDCYEVDYDLDGNSVTMLDERGEQFAEPIVQIIRDYPYEQYKQDKAKLIAEGENQRCIMSYHETLCYEEWQQELEREREMEEAYDEAYDEDYEQMCADIAEYERELEITREVAERDELTEYAEWAWECSMDESAAFGFIAIVDDLEELEDFAYIDKCIHELEADFDAGTFGGAEIAEYNELMGEFREMMGRECHV